jgi:hypothetical protein
MIADEGSHRYWAATLDRADALVFGRVTYQMMEAAWRGPARTGARPDWTVPLACSIASRALSGTLGRRPVGPRVRNAVAPSTCQRVCHRLALCPETSSSRATSAWERPWADSSAARSRRAWRAAQ